MSKSLSRRLLKRVLLLVIDLSMNFYTDTEYLQRMRRVFNAIRELLSYSEATWSGSRAWRHAFIKGRFTSHDDFSKCDRSISDHTISPSNRQAHEASAYNRWRRIHVDSHYFKHAKAHNKDRLPGVSK